MIAFCKEQALYDHYIKKTRNNLKKYFFTHQFGQKWSTSKSDISKSETKNSGRLRPYSEGTVVIMLKNVESVLNCNPFQCIFWILIPDIGFDKKLLKLYYLIWILILYILTKNAPCGSYGRLQKMGYDLHQSSVLFFLK